MGPVNSFDYDASKEVSFCETCIGGKHHKSPVPTSTGTRCLAWFTVMSVEKLAQINWRC